MLQRKVYLAFVPKGRNVKFQTFTL